MPDEVLMAAVIAAGVVLGLLIAVGLPVGLGLRHAARQRELEHAERMKALELGRPLPGEAAGEGGAAASKVVMIGLFVPLGALGIALAANTQPGSYTTHAAAWIAAGAVGVAGVIGGTILGLRQAAPGSAPSGAPFAKGPLPADAIDVVGRRG